MTVREPIPHFADALPGEAASIEALIPEAALVQVERAAAGRARSPLFVPTALLYATGLLLLLAFPRSVSAWLDDFTPSPMITVLRAGTGALESTANSMRVSSSLDAVRHKFLKQIQQGG